MLTNCSKTFLETRRVFLLAKCRQNAVKLSKRKVGVYWELKAERGGVERRKTSLEKMQLF